MAVSIAVVRIALGLLGESRYAVFQVLSAALAWLSLSSLGLGPALKNLVSECRARGEPDAPLRDASRAMLGLLCVLGALVIIALAPGVSAGLLRRLSHDQASAERAFLIAGLLSLVAAMGQVSIEVLYAQRRASWVYILSIGGSVLTLLIMTRLGQLGSSPPETLFSALCATAGPQAPIGLVALRMTGLLPLRLALPAPAAFASIGHLPLRV